MSKPETLTFDDDGHVPNSKLPLLLYRGALPASADAIEQRFAANGWSGGWRNGIFPYHHFHSTAHEVLGIAAGTAIVRFGGPGGQSVQVRAGDVVVIPAGVGHCRESSSSDLLVVGAYPGGGEYDTLRPDEADGDRVRRNIEGVATPTADPVMGRDAGLPTIWAG